MDDMIDGTGGHADDMTGLVLAVTLDQNQPLEMASFEERAVEFCLRGHGYFPSESEE
jgi:hypothetical protein